MSASGALGLMLVTGLVLFGSGALVITIARRTADGRIGINNFAGIRTRATRTSPKTWAAAHQAGLDLTVQGGQVIQASAIVGPIIGVLFRGDDWDRAVLIWSFVVVFAAVISVALLVYGAILGQRAAKELIAEDRAF